ncbi:glycosyltransferase family 2 protein, partial [Fournierella sp.]|uniref:glycosyltransferase family 2 protein n=2 Tax=Allofournierella sp. TaxID=1940256 RepID=UPI00345C39FB
APMRKISACIVSYNGADEVIRAVESLLKYTKDCALTVYLVDNASPDGTGETLERQGFPENVKVIRLPENLGFGKGHNQVLPLLDSEYHFVLNPDIFIDDNVLPAICDWLDGHPDVVMATPKLLFPDGRVQVLPKRKPNILGLAARQGVPGLKKFGDRYAMLDEDLSVPTAIEFCTGSFFCMRTSVYKAIGGFDEGYFMYVEDADITQKARQKGFVYYLPQFTAYHAWHRAPNKSLKPFLQQLKSMGRYFCKWGWKLGC